MDDSLTTLVAGSIAGFDAALEETILGTSDPDAIAEALSTFVAAAVGAPAGAVLYRPGVGIVAGFTLVDGRQVVLKVHRWHAAIERLRAVQQVQRALADAGLPAPRPLAEPAPLGAGVATVEELLVGDVADGHDPSVRALLAAELHRFIDVAPAASTVEVGRPLLLRPPDAPLWPEPHSVRFDFEATADGAGWIDDLAAEARARLDAALPTVGPDVVGHADWRVENLGFDGRRLVAIYDWDAVTAAPEPVHVGITAGPFCVDWARKETDPLPSVDEMRAFVEDYEAARGTPFTAAELEVLDAANLFLVAYGARCQHSDRTFYPDLTDDDDAGWPRLLRERGDRVWG